MLIFFSPRQQFYFKKTNVIVCDGNYKFKPVGSYEAYRVFGYVKKYPLNDFGCSLPQAKKPKNMWKKSSAIHSPGTPTHSPGGHSHSPGTVSQSPRTPTHSSNRAIHSSGAVIPSSGSAIHFTGCFSRDCIGPVVRVEGIMDAVKYRGILESTMLPHAVNKMPSYWIFQQDNDPKHMSKLMKQE